MPVEVIDLLSSSPIIAPSDPAPPPHATVNFAQKASPSSAISRQKLRTGFFDIDELSSDGDLPSLYAACASALPPSKPAPDAASAAPKATNDFIFLSDDFDSTIDLSQTYDLPPPSKRAQSPEKLQRRRSPVYVAGVNGLPRKDGLPGQHGMQRSVSSVENNNTGAMKAAGFKRSKTSLGIHDDPIMWTSSLDVVRDQVRETAARRMRGADTMGSDLFASSPVAGKRIDMKASEGLSKDKGVEVERAASCLEADSSDLDLPDFNTLASTQSQRSKSNETLKRKSSAAALKDYQAERKKRDKEVEKAMSKSDKAVEKEAEKERKRIIKEEKAREKAREQKLGKVNTLRTNKKVSTPEMIVDLPADLEGKLDKQVRGFLGTLGVEVTEWNSRIKNVVRWKRKVVAKYDEGKGYWEPCAPHVRVENHVLVVVAAQEFVDMATADEGNDLDAHVLGMKAAFGESMHIIYLVEGLMPWTRKNRNVRNRQYTEAVRRNMETESAQQKGKGKKKAEYVDEDSIEDALLKLQILNGVLIHHTDALIQTAEWIVAFTQHISTIPYRKEKMVLDTNFCMETGQVKTGENPSDTYVKMLQEIVRITAPIAYGIAAEHPTVQSLVKALREKGPECLKGCRKAMNKDGGFSDREIGVAVSKRVYKIFLGRDVGSADV